MLVHNLLRELLDQRAGDVRFNVTDLTIDLADGARPCVRYADATGAHALACAYVVGCDGSRGTSRAAIPAGVLTTASHEFGYAWLAALVEAPLLRQIHTLQGDEQQLFRLPIVKALVQAVGYQVVAAATANEQQVLGRHSARQLELVRAFQQLLRQPATARQRPADYAAALHVSARYLNDTMRAVTGFSLTHHLQQELVREAQRLLVQPGLSVSEVAYRLHFDDPKYFSRLFRRVVGISPGIFRQRWGRNRPT